MISVHNLPFSDWRKFGFVRVAAFAPEGRVADPKFNVGSHIKELEQLVKKGVMYAVAPELGLSGYTCGELFFSTTLQKGVLNALAVLVEESKKWNMIFSVGTPLKFDNKLYNCSVTVYRGQILKVTPKAYLPNYGEFYEVRYFASGAGIRGQWVTLLGQEVPFGVDIVIECSAHPGLVIAEDICEDIWMVLPPSSEAALLANATVLGNLSASNITIGKSNARVKLIEDAGRSIALRIYSAAGWGESTSDLAWDADCMIAENGNLITRTNRFVKGSVSCITDADIYTLSYERQRQTTYSQHAAQLAQQMPDVSFRKVVVEEILGITEKNTKVYQSLLRKLDKLPFVPDEGPERDERCYEVFMIQGTALARRLTYIKERYYKGEDQYPYLFVGVSGGRDSTHALLVCAWALDYLGWSRSQLIGITMPGFGTGDDTYKIACQLVPALGGALIDQPIVEYAKAHLAEAGYDIKTDVQKNNLPYQNIQAWERNVKLMVHAATHGGIVVGTGDLSEQMIGWCTLYGDHASYYNPNAGAPKTLISFLIGWVRHNIFADDELVKELLTKVLALEVSPELLPPDVDGKIIQKTDDENGPVTLRDFLMYYIIRYGSGMDRICRLAFEAYGDEMSLVTIKKWTRIFVQKFFDGQFKRNTVAPGSPKIGLVALGPRGDWRMPDDAMAYLWLEELENVPDTF